MSRINRWDVETMDERTSSEGRWVLYSDHEAEVARLRAEVEKNRVDAERYRWLRDEPWRGNEDLEPVIRLQLNALWDERIDAAMGEEK